MNPVAQLITSGRLFAQPFPEDGSCLLIRDLAEAERRAAGQDEENIWLDIREEQSVGFDATDEQEAACEALSEKLETLLEKLGLDDIFDDVDYDLLNCFNNANKPEAEHSLF